MSQTSIWALVPVKDFAQAKGRLASALHRDERRALAEAMLRDVLDALQQARRLAGIALLGGRDARRLATEFGLDYLPDAAAGDLNEALHSALPALEQRQATHVVILPDDLPTVSATDIDTLLATAGKGISLCPASRDGGTNALLLPVHAGLRFCYGPESARLHLEAALAAGLPAQKLSTTAFGRDIDKLEDLVWLCEQSAAAHSQDYLKTAGIARRLTDAPQTALPR